MTCTNYIYRISYALYFGCAYTVYRPAVVNRFLLVVTTIIWQLDDYLMQNCDNGKREKRKCQNNQCYVNYLFGDRYRFDVEWTDKILGVGDVNSDSWPKLYVCWTRACPAVNVSGRRCFRLSAKSHLNQVIGYRSDNDTVGVGRNGQIGNPSCCSRTVFFFLFKTTKTV